MARDAALTTLADALNFSYVAVPVVFDDGIGYVADSVPTQVGTLSVPRSVSKDWARTHGLKPDAGSTVVVRALSGPSLVLVSLGASYNHANDARLAGAGAAKAAGESDVAFLVPREAVEDAPAMASALVEGALLSSFSYKKDAVTGRFAVAVVGASLPSVPEHDAIEVAVSRGATIAEGVNWAKRLIDTPAGYLPPKELARKVERRLDDDPSVKVDVWNEKRCADERLGGLIGVGAGSAEPVRMVIAKYAPKGSNNWPHVALVGKGVCFDSGGLSLKSGEGMMTMKYDMSGAAIVMAATSIAARLGLQVRVTAYAPMTENMPSGTAIKPGDVITIRNGKTVEVLNTDAEGRLILADALSLAVEANPDAIIDVATLTGAVKIALGEDIGAIFASTDELADLFTGAASEVGEPFWRLPLYDAYESHIESDVADLKNLGKAGSAGTISAALFLRHFTSGRPWIHLDIAGAGRTESPKGFQSKGALAYSARSMVQFLANVASA